VRKARSPTLKVMMGSWDSGGGEVESRGAPLAEEEVSSTSPVLHIVGVRV